MEFLLLKLGVLFEEGNLKLRKKMVVKGIYIGILVGVCKWCEM